MRKEKSGNRITFDDYIKAVKKADREIELQQHAGFQSRTRIHKSKKIYNRKEGKKTEFDSSFFYAYA
ncbi:MAG TPA: hypothetical protein PLN63_00135 [Paludibacteraceae bacterium]|nr:hypothetical protein [Paludibacteraceae bacterium]HOU68828.1 hypothetical protein [Paludibacteraceae bacterium]HPH62021.1 hypothetical protein [Paludibacteraceae bacterium]HQF50588.1 hypothetical protein [Paludibacteraceae bacterium]HQJ89193.1 hypothetical protein [Paludibacteraceae bacterium]